MKEYSTHTLQIDYNRNNMQGFFKMYQEACIERNQYQSETDKLTSIDNLSDEEPFNNVKDNIVTWLADMAKAGLINPKDSISVNKLLTDAYSKLNSSAIDEKLKELNHIATQKLNNIQRSFDEAKENTGYLTQVLNVQILGLTMDKVETINKILEKEGVHITKNYYDNGSKERGNFDIKVYSDNKEKLSDIQDEIAIASLKQNFKGNVKRSTILDSEEAFKLMTDMRNPVMIGSHINKIIRPDEMVYNKPKNVGKPKF
jgi:hypothetical protein